MVNSFLSKEEISDIGFSEIGDNILISRYARFYSPEKMVIGSNVRIDDFCVLSGRIELGNNIHISASSSFYGGNAGIIMKDYSGVSGRCSLYAVSDDFSGEYVANSMAPLNARNPIEKEIILEKYVQIGAGSTILPGVIIKEGACVGSMSLVNKTLDSWGIYVGVPCGFLKKRNPLRDDVMAMLK